MIASTFHPRRQGDAGEATAIHWFTAAGGTVSFPLFHSPDYDLIADFGKSLLRVQVKTSSRRVKSGYLVQLATSGGNRSWTGLVRTFHRRRCDLLFVLVADGRIWVIPAGEIEGTRGVVVGGRKYGEFQVEPPCSGKVNGTLASRLSGPETRGSAGVGEPGGTVNSVPRAEWVRLPPPPSSNEPDVGVHGVGRTVISKNHQLTIPSAPFEAAGLASGDQIRVEAAGAGCLAMTRCCDFAAASRRAAGMER